jgi:hypothetical protein
LAYKVRASLQQSPEFREKRRFPTENKAKILAKWWDLPPTVGQISEET